ncbi:MAG: glycosyltransferase family A protein [Candidatus Omnitrophota bacterium]
MISVIIPTYNRSILLKRAIESVLDQAYKDLELLIIDDGSTDNTREYVESQATSHRPQVRYFYQTNKGPSSARNLGIKKAQGSLIAFLDSDDWWDREKLAIQIEEMNKKPTFLISHTQEIWYRKNKLLNQKRINSKSNGYIFNRCLSICSVSMSTVIIRKGLFDRIGLFDEKLPCCEDYDFWLRASKEYPFLLIDKPLTLKDGGRPDQLSHLHRNGMDRFRIYSIVNLLEETGLNDEQRQLAIKELANKCRIYGQGCIKHGRKDEGEGYINLIKKHLQ